MHLRTVEELRAIVGDDGKDWSDEQLLAADRHAAVMEDVILGHRLDQLDPVAALRRRQAARAADAILLAKRRVRYERERQRKNVRRSA